MYLKKIRGATTLVITTMLVIAATLVVMFSASYSLLQQKITSNQLRNNQAFEAAQAGLEYGIVYLRQNRSTIVANPSGGYINYTTGAITNVTFSNGSRYSIVYSNPIANNYDIITITSTGVSDDGTATRVVSQQVYNGSLLFSPGQVPLVSKGSFSLGGNATVTNTTGGTTINTGGNTTLSGNVKTVLNSGTSSTPGNIKSDIQQNDSGISSLSSSDFFARYFGASSSMISSQFQHIYSNTGSTNYSSTLNGMQGTTIWINQTSGSAVLSGNTTIGSPTNPVLLVINGDFDISGNVTIYGFVFVMGSASATTDITGNVSFNGSLVTGSSLNISGNTSITFNNAVNTAIQNSTAADYQAKVPGSWADF